MSRDQDNHEVDRDVAEDDDRDATGESEGASSQAGPTENDAPRPVVPPPGVSAPTNGQARVSSQPGNQDSRPCIVIGTKGAGKTALLLAINRACHLPTDDNLEIAFVAEGATHELIQQSAKIITELRIGPDATEPYKKQDDYPFRVEARLTNRRFWERPVRESIYAVVKDVPGGSLFPINDSEAKDSALRAKRQELVKLSKTAGSMVFCIDATEANLPVLDPGLPLLLYEMSEVVSVSEAESRRALPFIKRSQPDIWHRHKRCISVNRFLLLLTKVDQLCDGFSSPARYASWIDPVEQARGMLGLALLNTIKDYLMPGTKFAVGISSAWGFHTVGGQPFAGAQGRASQLSNITPEETLMRWKPFGIRDAIFFLTTGKCRGMVKEITSKDLLDQSELEPHEIPYDELDRPGRGDKHGSQAT